MTSELFPVLPTPPPTHPITALTPTTASAAAVAVQILRRDLDDQQHRRIGRPYRRIRRWSRHTPTGDIVALMLSVGVALVFIASVIAFVAL